MPPPPHATLDGLLAAVRDFAAANYPGDRVARLTLELDRAGTLTLPVPSPPSAGPCSHSPDFASILWFGTPYRFSPTQAAVVAQLWAAWESGCPEVGGAALLEAAGSASGKVSDLFRDSPAWRDEVVGRAGKSAYRLYAPADLA